MAEPNESLLDQVKELWQLVLGYFKQETVEPVKNLGRFIRNGLAGSLLIGFGLVLLTLAALRALQSETGSHFQGNNSWIPYVIVLVGLFILIIAVVAGIVRTSRPRESKEETSGS